MFHQEVTLDLGWNKTLDCGLVLQEHFDELAGFQADTMKYHSNTMELYFETEDFDAFITLLDQYPDVERLHEPKTFPWMQRGIRIFDPDGHLIEVAESMYCVACRQFAQGKNVEDVKVSVQRVLIFYVNPFKVCILPAMFCSNSSSENLGSLVRKACTAWHADSLHRGKMSRRPHS